MINTDDVKTNPQGLSTVIEKLVTLLEDRKDDKYIEQLARLDERFKTLAENIEVAHRRIDKHNADVSTELQIIREEIEPLNAWMNRGKGGIAVLLLAGSMVGGLIVALAQYFIASVRGQ